MNEYGLTDPINFGSQAFGGGGLPTKTFGQKLFGAIDANPLGFGMNMLGAGFDAFNKIGAMDRQIRQTNRGIDLWGDEVANIQPIGIQGATLVITIQTLLGIAKRHQRISPKVP